MCRQNGKKVARIVLHMLYKYKVEKTTLDFIVALLSTCQLDQSDIQKSRYPFLYSDTVITTTDPAKYGNGCTVI
jgi:hypothetical protein